MSSTGRLEIEEVTRPVPGPGEALIRIEGCGICGSDLHFYRARSMRPGHTPGHEMAGVVAATGADVSDLPDATRVAARVQFSSATASLLWIRSETELALQDLRAA